MRFQDIPQFTSSGSYQVNQMWDFLVEHVEEEIKRGLILSPDYQRGHVWTEDQQRAYVEYVLRGGRSGLDLWFNCPGWMRGYKGPYELVDGKQRLHAALKFLRNEMAIFPDEKNPQGYFHGDFTDKLRMMVSFIWHVNDLPKRSQVLQWYIEMNAGGTVHAPEEIERVKGLLLVTKARECGATSKKRK